MQRETSWALGGSCRLQGSVPSFKRVRSVVSSGIICRGEARDAVDKRVGDGTRWALQSLTGSDGDLGRVPSFDGGALRLPLWNYPLWEQKRNRGLDSGTETRWHLRSLAGSADTLGRVPLFERGGRSATPPECSVVWAQEMRWTREK